MLTLFLFSFSNKTATKKDDAVQGLLYKNLNGKSRPDASPTMEIKRIAQQTNTVFGTSLQEVEKDEEHPDIPRFVVECIKVIEMKQNIETDGIYRASGKKDKIDKLRKKVSGPPFHVMNIF